MNLHDSYCNTDSNPIQNMPRSPRHPNKIRMLLRIASGDISDRASIYILAAKPMPIKMIDIQRSFPVEYADNNTKNKKKAAIIQKQYLLFLSFFQAINAATPIAAVIKKVNIMFGSGLPAHSHIIKIIAAIATARPHGNSVVEVPCVDCAVEVLV